MATKDAGQLPEVAFKPIGPRIRRRREELGLTRADLVARLNGSMSVRDIARLEDERILFPSWIRLLQLADALEVTPAELIGSE